MSYESDVEKRNGFLEKKVADLEDEIGYLSQYYNQHLILLAMTSVLLDTVNDIADHGTKVDTNPTLAGQQDIAWWYNYINSADQNVRRSCKDALETIRSESHAFDMNLLKEMFHDVEKHHGKNSVMNGIIEMFERLYDDC
jgi:hypothetical protein